jgi:hypothetical protein
VVPRHLGIREFVNADEIARGPSPFNAERAALAAGRLMIARMRDLVQAGESSGFSPAAHAANGRRSGGEEGSSGWPPNPNRGRDPALEDWHC